MKKQPKQQLRLAHFPQLPCKPFIIPVANVAEAVKIATTIWDYDKFQFENRIKPDYSNATTLEVFEDGEWCDWYSDCGMSFDDVVAEMKEAENAV